MATLGRARALRGESLAQALARFDRPATVIAESPDEASTQAIRAILRGRLRRRTHDRR